MTVNRTTLLDLPLPVTGTESGTWGDTTNNGLTQYVDIAIAGMSNLTSANFTAGALTIETTEGDSSATNISATSAQYAGFRVTSLAANSTITVGNTGTSPARSYRLINADATYNLTFKATGQTGVTLLPGQSALVAFNGTDYVIVGTVGAGSTTDNTVPRFDGTTGKILQSSGITIDDSNNVSGVAQLNITTLDATNIEVTNIKAKDGTAAASIADSTGVISVTANPVLSGGTANGVLYLNGSKVATSGSALTFTGSVLGVNNSGDSDFKLTTSNTGSGSTDGLLLRINSTGSEAYLWNWEPSSVLIFGANGSEQMRLTSTGLGIGTSSFSEKLRVEQTAVATVAQFRKSSVANVVIGYNGTSVNYNDVDTQYWRTAAASDLMVLTSTGLGIGTSSPAAKLHVVGSSQFTTTSGTGYLEAYGGSSFKIRSSATMGVEAATGSSVNFVIGGSEVGRFSDTGNLGIGTSSPVAKLTVGGSGNIKLQGGAVSFDNPANNRTFSISAVDTPALVFTDVSAGQERMRLDSSGNLGLGVTPSAWGSDFKAIQVNDTGASLWSYRSGATSEEYLYLSNNSYNTNTYDIYIRDGAAVQYRQLGGTHAWFNAASGTAGNTFTFTQAMTLDASANLQLNTTTSKVTQFGGSATGMTIGSATYPVLSLWDTGDASWNFCLAQDGGTAYLYNNANGPMLFYTNGSERARITSGGYFKASNNGTYLDSTGTYHEIRQTLSGNNTLQISNTTADPYGVVIAYTGAAPNGTDNYFLYCRDSGPTLRANIRSNGGLANYSANDVNLSDRREKTNFAPAKSYLDTICAIPVQTFNYIDQAEDDPGLTLGVVAQDVQAVAPELVMESNWGTEENPKMRLSIYQTDLQYALMKCIQEQQALITSLTARVALLEGN